MSNASFAFTPPEIAVPAGTKVTWKTRDQEVHAIVSETKEFRSVGLDTNDSSSSQFDEPGTYTYRCSLHPYMKGKIAVAPKH